MKTKLVIFGVTGDLSRRKLLPALGNIVTCGECGETEVIGVSRREINTQVLSDLTGKALKISGFTMNIAEASEYVRLRKFLALKNNEQLIIYLSVPPTAATRIVDFLGGAGLNSPNVKLLFEKPFGIDHASAVEMIERTGRYFKEEHIYRIDHYLAKEMAQNIVALRSGNALFTHLWNNATIEKIEVVALEKIGIEGRAGFYEQTGALRDVVQGHLMQLLALVLMELPPRLEWDKLPMYRLSALRQLTPADPKKAVRAQYDSYQQEVENPGSRTETFVSLELTSEDPLWRDVPLHVVAGKALNEKTTEIRLHLRPRGEAKSNCVTLKIQPDEGVTVQLFTKKPGYERRFETQTLKYTYPEDAALPEAYEQVLVDAIRSEKSLFTSSDEVLRSWQVLQPLLDEWQMDGNSLKTYPCGASTHTICSV